MNAPSARRHRHTLRRFLRAVADLLTSDVRRAAWLLVILLFAFAMAVNGLNVVNSYVGRDFMTAVADRDMPRFANMALLYVGMFATITVVAVLYRFAEERLGLLWRSWLTRRVIGRYLQDRTYLQLKESGQIGNPDQRIAEDIRAFTATTLSFTLIFVNGTLAAISFSGVLWSISPMLFMVAVAYAGVGTLLTILLGRPLVGLNYRQSDREADLRADLIHVRENAESIAILRREGRIKARLLGRLDALVDNVRRIIAVNRNLSFFTTGYNYLIPVVPTLFIAPSYIRGEIDFGVITQSAIAFAQLLGAFSLIVNQFGSISSFAAVVARLDSLAEAVESTGAVRPGIVTREDAAAVAYEQLTLTASPQATPLIADLSLTIPRGTCVQVTGSNEAARIALFHATAGIWPDGQGQITRPPLDDILFLPQKPYIVPGTLRDVLVRTGRDISDQQVRATLHDTELDALLQRVGDLDAEMDWAGKLSLQEQQQLAVARLLLAAPAFALLDRTSTTLSPPVLRAMLQALAHKGITFMTFDTSPDIRDLHQGVLELHDNGAWHWQPNP